MILGLASRLPVLSPPLGESDEFDSRNDFYVV